MIDLAYTPAEKREESAELKGPEVPDYPWGLQLRLEGDSLDKLGIDALPAIGEILNINALCRVTSISQSASEGNDEDCRCVTLQITAMDIVPSDASKVNPPAPKRTKSILSHYSGGTGND